jgi:hypothetical protein
MGNGEWESACDESDESIEKRGDGTVKDLNVYFLLSLSNAAAVKGNLQADILCDVGSKVRGWEFR